jgi:prefoldin subunit 5
VNRIKEIDSLIEAVEKKLVQLDEQRAIIQNQLDELKKQRHLLINQKPSDSTSQADQP